MTTTIDPIHDVSSYVEYCFYFNRVVALTLFPSSTIDQRIIGWIRTQLFAYVAISVLAPISDNFYMDLTFLSDILICLAHRYFPSSLPDLIGILSLRRQQFSFKISVACQIFSTHLGLPPPSSPNHQTLLQYLNRLHHAFMQEVGALHNSTKGVTRKELICLGLHEHRIIIYSRLSLLP